MRFLYDNNGERLVSLFEPKNNPSANDYFVTLLEHHHHHALVRASKKGGHADAVLLAAVDRLVLRLLFSRNAPGLENT